MKNQNRGTLGGNRMNPLYKANMEGLAAFLKKPLAQRMKILANCIPPLWVVYKARGLSPKQILNLVNETAPPIDIKGVARVLRCPIQASKAGISEHEDRWSTARAIAGLFLQEEKEDGTTVQATAYQTNKFAAELLMPASMLKVVAGQFTLDQLASLFAVPVGVMKARIGGSQQAEG